LNLQEIKVHGDIRHLEKMKVQTRKPQTVHGDIRHLEKYLCKALMNTPVHGDIRHLEINPPTLAVL